MTDVTKAHARRRVLAGLAAAVGLAVTAALVPAGGAAGLGRTSANVRQTNYYPVPPGGVYTFVGRGFGHGHGMSQWGADGAATVDHLSANQILHFYYPHTTLATRSTDQLIRVLITAADVPSRGYLEVNPSKALAITPAGGKRRVLPTSREKHKVEAWRLLRSGTSLVLQHETEGHWHRSVTVGSGATFSDKAQQIRVDEPAGVVSYRGSMTGEIESGELEAVENANLELYIDSVVPAEMPSSWPAAALQAQAVAARTYARREIAGSRKNFFDIYGDDRSQSAGGVGKESSSATRAVAVTAGEVIVNSHRHVILAQYAAADGGWTLSGGKPYLPSKQDPYDGLVANDAHSWTTSVSASSLQAAYPAVGTLHGIEITGRDGHGLWGGRVTTLKLIGSGSTESLTGPDLQFALGLKSPWFRPVPPPRAPGEVAAKPKGRRVSVTWRAPKRVHGGAAITGYRLSAGVHHKNAKPTARSATIANLNPGDHVVTVVARSSAGNSPAATTTVTIAK